MSWGRYPKAGRRRPADGIVAQTQRGQQFGKTWWASQWLTALEALVDTARLGRGRSYARSGQVLNIDVTPGKVSARVQGSRPTPYKITIEIDLLTAQAWDAAIEAMAGQALFAAKLLAGEMPQNIEEAFAAAQVSLFPRARKEMRTECSCPDWANPCKHLAAVFYLLGEQFDTDPFLLFVLRGRTREQIVEALRSRRTAGAEAAEEPVAAEATPAPAKRGRRKAPVAEPAPRLVEDVARFWTPGAALDDFRVEVASPPVEAAIAKQLGAPPWWPEGKRGADWERVMTQVCACVTKQGMEVAFEERAAD